MWWSHRRDRRGSKSGHVQAGSNLWDRGNREPDRCGRNDLLNRGLSKRAHKSKEGAQEKIEKETFED